MLVGADDGMDKVGIPVGVGVGALLGIPVVCSECSRVGTWVGISVRSGKSVGSREDVKCADVGIAEESALGDSDSLEIVESFDGGGDGLIDDGVPVNGPPPDKNVGAEEACNEGGVVNENGAGEGIVELPGDELGE